jgi:nucleoside-diphosphate-sugar epimerase
MKVFLAGATGALGKQLVPQLVEAGHEVTGMTRSADKVELVRRLGAEPVVADALDPDAVARAIGEAEPDAVAHELTAIPPQIDMRRPDRTFAQTNRLRTEGTDHLLSAAWAAGVKRFVAQSYAGWPYAREGGPVKAEEDRLDPSPPRNVAETLAAIRHVEEAVMAAGGVVLRYGGFYGPGTNLSVDPPGAMLEMIRGRKVPVIGDGAGVWSFVHVEDAAAATVKALEHAEPGIYNVVDDEPARVSEWLPGIAGAVGAKPPRRVPRALARLLAGETATLMMTESRGASNAKAKRELGWRPRYASWREGFAAG